MALLSLFLTANICVFALSSANPISHSDEINTQIMGGYLTTIEEHPWQVSVQHSGDHNCGGVIIGDKWILTTATCDGQEVRVGSSYHANGGSIVFIKRTIIHENFNDKPYDYDYALWELAEPLEFNDRIQPIALPDLDSKVEEGTVGTFAAFGYTLVPSDPRHQLHALEMAVTNRDLCIEQYKGVINITERMFCAKGTAEYSSACFLDGGHGLVQFSNGTPKLVGVLGFGLCGLVKSNLFSNITPVLPWIKSITGI